jgi:hypothetical protein
VGVLMNIVRNRSYIVTEEQETLESIIKKNYGDIKKIKDVILFLEQFNLILSSELYKGDTVLLPNLPKHLTGEDPNYVKYPLKQNSNIKNIISNFYENENINLDKTENYIKTLNNIKHEPYELNSLLLPVNLPSYFYSNKTKKDTINFVECFNKVFHHNEFEEI